MPASFPVGACSSAFFVDVFFDATELHVSMASLKGQLDVPLTVYPWYLLGSLGILGDYNP